MIKEIFKSPRKSEEPGKPVEVQQPAPADEKPGETSEATEPEAEPQEPQTTAGKPESEPEEPQTTAGEPEAEAEEPDPIEAAYCLGAGIDTETLAKAKALIKEFADATSSGVFNPSVLRYALKLLNYDSDMEAARKETEDAVRARLADSKLSSKQSRAREAASIPHLGGSSGIGTATGNSIFDIAKGVR